MTNDLITNGTQVPALAVTVQPAYSDEAGH